MKMLVLAILVIGGYFIYQTTIGSAERAYSFCLELTKEQLVLAEQLSCGAQREVLEELSSCIVTVQRQSNIKSFLYNPLGFKIKIDTLIETHNEECPNSEVKIPEEGLYF